jgi:hypothetical protein
MNAWSFDVNKRKTGIKILAAYIIHFGVKITQPIL